MKARCKKRLPIFCATLILLFFSACNQRYWFRQKSGSKINTDSTQVEKEYQIIW